MCRALSFMPGLRRAEGSGGVRGRKRSEKGVVLALTEVIAGVLLKKDLLSHPSPMECGKHRVQAHHLSFPVDQLTRPQWHCPLHKVCWQLIRDSPVCS